MDYIVGWKRIDAVLKRFQEWSIKSEDTLLPHTEIALKKYYWNKLGGIVSREMLMKPIFDMADYVHKAFNANLEKDKECLYAGTIFLNSILKETGRKFTLDVREANILSDVGKRLAKHIWKGLEESNGDHLVYEHLVSTIVNSLWKDYIENK